MKHFAAIYLQSIGTMDKAQFIEKSLGQNPIDLDSYRFHDRKAWLFLHIFFVDLISQPYMIERSLALQKLDPGYQPSIIDFSTVFLSSVDATLKFIQSIDQVCQQATDSYFPDLLLNQTYPPEIGPYQDLFSTIIETQTKLPIAFLNPYYLSLGLSLASKPKQIENAHTLKKSDMVFLGKFLCYLRDNPKRQALIDPYLDDELAMTYIMLTFPPKHRLHTLLFDRAQIDACFDQLTEKLKLYVDNPNAALALLGLSK